MRKSIVWVGIVIVLIGALMVFVGGLLIHTGYGTMMGAIEDYSESAMMEAYDQVRTGEFVVYTGLFIAFLGIATGLSGMTLEPAPVMHGPYAQPYQQTQPTYPAQPPQAPQEYPPAQPPQYPQQP